MRLTALIILIYGIVILVSGIYGFVVSDSVISLILGVIVGVSLLGNSYSTLHHNFTGVYITIIVSTILTIVFGIRLTQTLRILPVGLMFITSVVSLGFSIYALSYRKTNEPET